MDEVEGFEWIDRIEGGKSYGNRKGKTDRHVPGDGPN
jgi:hypothetical protein